MKCLNLLPVLCLSLAISVPVGCGSESTPPATSANQGGEIQLSDNVVKLLRENNTKTAAVKAHQKETSLSLSEAKKQDETVMERDGISVGEEQ